MSHTSTGDLPALSTTFQNWLHAQDSDRARRAMEEWAIDNDLFGEVLGAVHQPAMNALHERVARAAAEIMEQHKG